MTSKEYEEIANKLEKYRELSRETRNFDLVIDAIDDRIDMLEEADFPAPMSYICLSIEGVNFEFCMNTDQLTKLKELLDSCRYDVRKRLEEL